MSVLDEVLPEFARRTRYERVVHASPEATWAALRALTDDELPLSRLLVAARGLRPGAVRGSRRPVVDAFLSRGFSLLRDEPPRALVAGAAGRPWRPRGEIVRVADAAELAAFDRPGHVRMAVSFELEPDGPGRTRVATETRVQPTDESAARAFRRYWAVVRIGSDAIRLDVLRGLRRRGEAG